MSRFLPGFRVTINYSWRHPFHADVIASNEDAAVEQALKQAEALGTRREGLTGAKVERRYA